ncbi:MAG: SixA phosphatase family protein [Roseibacillus sp.]
MNISLSSLTTLIFLSVLAIAPACGQDKPKRLVAFLVRHAEKMETGEDPDLTAAGESRARDLAAMLRTAGITQVHSSDYKRTRNTAAPTAELLGLKVRIYDPRDLPTLVVELKAAGGRHLIVGHSNTTPALAKLLGGQAGAPVDEKREYDRLYVITVDAGGEASTVLLRYGAPFLKGK